MAYKIDVEQVLLPALRPGEIVVWDNLSASKGIALQQAIEAAEAKVWPLTPCGLHFTPIEPMGVKLKR